MRFFLAVCAVVVLPLLNGCAAVVLGGAAATGGYLVGEDRRSAAVMTDDQTIEIKASNRISEKYPNVHVASTSFNKLVLLSGEVPDAAAKAEIDRIVRGIEGVRGTYNELQVGPVSPISARANDSYITSKVKTRFLDGRRFNPVHVKVVTDAGTVYLMGLVKKQEATDAAELARTTSGVTRVVRLFELQD
ncbi:MAG: transport-associated protein [Betaproteobacteria bacterium]|nr:transport-associated protein [Betaproteobacteria bacterium]